jgi:hypothetical protein
MNEWISIMTNGTVADDWNDGGGNRNVLIWVIHCGCKISSRRRHAYKGKGALEIREIFISGYG